MNVFTYWEQIENGLRYEYIEQCAKAMTRVFAGCNVIRLTPQNVDSFVDLSVLPYQWSVLPVSKKADCIRAVALMQHGGLWVDADTIPIKTPAGRFSDSFCYMQWSKEPRRVLNGYVYSPKGSDVSVAWVSSICRAIRDGLTSWTALGEQCLTPAVESHEGSCVRIPLSTFLPVEIDVSPALLLSRKHVDSFCTEETIAFGLNHSWLSNRHSKQLKMSAFRTGKAMIHTAFRKYVLEE